MVGGSLKSLTAFTRGFFAGVSPPLLKRPASEDPPAQHRSAALRPDVEIYEGISEQSCLVRFSSRRADRILCLRVFLSVKPLRPPTYGRGWLPELASTFWGPARAAVCSVLGHSWNTLTVNATQA